MKILSWIFKVGKKYTLQALSYNYSSDKSSIQNTLIVYLKYYLLNVYIFIYRFVSFVFIFKYNL